ncbi:bifunctional diaminohydroxyphosphoribosylaminopyrimidine deaminase/5-amino-6-(5-phosphoribosylamino)uracil reductase RibD [Hyphomicrobium sp. LHD-15]|uniref:bifunctional diaminohydroxyphosphoribosylaminopyrimidine deaminase/5-amino-6-(5-phosphoribosylamino)uracil reductase RibD n=1 Tax=Hyphomicrobium sp. LHD-15 TaxID=3072142 RepID=UPI0035BE6444
MMGIALMLARRGLGTTAPNPSVGAVIADEATGELIARGVTQPGGRPHAETEALKRAGALARGATLYVTLEPCAHHGKTPPCADAVVAAGIGRVVIGVDDPDPRVKGDGIARLRAAGLTVETGLLGEEARWATLGHILRVTERRPFVQLKMALDAAGAVPRGKAGTPLFVTGSEARAQGHLLRAKCDAIVVGSGTVRDDDPDLTCRLPGLAARSPVRVVISGSLALSRKSKLVQTARTVPTWVFTGEAADAAQVGELESQGVKVFRVLPSADGVLLGAVLTVLAAEGVTRVLVEGGASLWRAFAAEGLVDEVALFQAGPMSAGAAGEGASAAALAAGLAPGLDLALASRRRVGADTLSLLRVRARHS